MTMTERDPLCFWSHGTLSDDGKCRLCAAISIARTEGVRQTTPTALAPAYLHVCVDEHGYFSGASVASLEENARHYARINPEYGTVVIYEKRLAP